MNAKEIIKRLEQANLDKLVSFNYNSKLAELSKYSKSSQVIQKLSLLSNYDCNDYAKITFDGMKFNDNDITVKEFISMLMPNLFKDIQFCSALRELEIKDIVIIDTPISDIGVVIVLEDKERK